MGLIDRRETDEITVTVRHRCPEYVFGSALGPGPLTSWWWLDSWGSLEVLTSDTRPRPWGRLQDAIKQELAGLDLRRHLDELAELPDVPQW